jgi:hypothetical protein
MADSSFFGTDYTDYTDFCFSLGVMDDSMYYSFESPSWFLISSHKEFLIS